ncbi:monovalent cation/H(+) antiporter subunit G [Micromonospora sp. MS34]|uniref:monovalent cation/H(+) antiporter subunit G n=1 Tax=Micromonospora sp. MS34 TaxID=3385971 RepID=UPI0039A04584
MSAVVADWLGAACLVAGGLLSLAAGIGVLRFPDVLARMHAATKPQVLGVLLLLLGLALRLRSPADLGMIGLVALFQLATAPVAAQMIGRAAYRSGRTDPDLLDTDELAGR